MLKPLIEKPKEKTFCEVCKTPTHLKDKFGRLTCCRGCGEKRVGDKSAIVRSPKEE